MERPLKYAGSNIYISERFNSSAGLKGFGPICSVKILIVTVSLFIEASTRKRTD